VLRSNLESPALRVYRSLITWQHIFRFSVQWGEARDTIHFLGTPSQPHPHYVPVDQILCPVTINKCGQNPRLVGRHFEVQLSFTLQKSDDVDAKFEPVFSLLPVDLYSLLLSLYGYVAVDRHAIKLMVLHSVLMASVIPQRRSSS
jgi:hypothetical protein